MCCAPVGPLRKSRPLSGGRSAIVRSTVLRAGDGRDGGPRFTIGPPFGDEMIIALAARSPLFAQARPQGEAERDFLSAFRKVFLYKPRPDMPDRVIRADYVTLTTREK